MSLKLVVNKSKYCHIHGKRYARDIRRENRESQDIQNLRILLRDKYNELLYNEILLTKSEESLSKQKQKKYEELMRRIKQIRE
ncbi:MAG: hypothetical protein CMK44_00945 [Porticoccus sp.]|nr:hypothetical protein [Porticoccus sp.]|tara:strand:- start:2062 stop:2310 length:249 start_codon:yes stop_codon:yes gene_type:complete